MSRSSAIAYWWLKIKNGITALISYQLDQITRIAGGIAVSKNKASLGAANDLLYYAGRAKQFATDMNITGLTVTNLNVQTYLFDATVDHDGYVLSGSWNNFIGFDFDGNVRFRNKPSTPESRTFNTGFSNGERHRFALVLTDTAITLYIDGVLFGSQEADSSLGDPLTANWSKIGDAGGNYLNGQLANLQIWNKAFTPSDVIIDYNTPKRLVNMVANDVADTGVSVVKSDCQLMLTMTEDGEYVVDVSKDVGLNDGVASISIDGIGNTANHDGVDTFSIHQEVVTLVSYRPYIGMTKAFEANKTFLFEVFITVTNGQVYIDNWEYGAVADGSSKTYQIDETLTPGTYSYSFIGNRRSNNSCNLLFDGTQNAIADFTAEMKVREISAHQINNYLTLPDPNIRGLNTGLQTAGFTLNPIGMIEGVGNGAEWHGAEYGDTRWVPSGVFAIEFVYGEVTNDGLYHLNGSDSNLIRFGETAEGKIYARMGSQTYDFVPTGKTHGIMNSTGEVYFNGTLHTTLDGAFLSVHPMFLGASTADGVTPRLNMKSDLPLFKAHSAGLNATEALAAYNDAVAKGYL